MIKVSGDKKHLVRCEGNNESPFFWIGDTAWLLFPKLSLEEIDGYLKDRAGKCFNVIQAVLVSSTNEDDTKANSLPIERESNRAVIGNDFSKIDFETGYWDKVDKVIEMAKSYDIYMGLLPVWGSMVKNGYLTMKNVQSYGEFLAQRYSKYDNIIWILGGDIRGDDGYDIWNKLGETIKTIAPHQFMTFHPFGRTSSDMWFSEAKWIDMHMFQSGHRRYDQGALGLWDDNNVSEDFYGEDSWRYVKRSLNKNLKPILDGEPSYEEILQGLHDPREPYWKDKDVRRYAYWSIFEGACGHTYGHNSIMQFYTENDQNGSYGVKEYWQEAMNSKGSTQMKYLYQLMTRFDLTDSMPCDEILVGGQKNKHDRIACLKGKDFALFYNYTGQSFKIYKEKLDFEFNNLVWFDPVTGIYSDNINIDTNQEILELISPIKNNEHNDWVLVINKR